MHKMQQHSMLLPAGGWERRCGQHIAHRREAIVVCNTKEPTFIAILYAKSVAVTMLRRANQGCNSSLAGGGCKNLLASGVVSIGDLKVIGERGKTGRGGQKKR